MGTTFKEGLENITFKAGLLGATSKNVFIWARGSSELSTMEMLPLSLETAFTNFTHSYSENGDSSFYRNTCNDYDTVEIIT